tara:strand:- start:1161 stop:1565 length:405 start_codon:yes stop_codon:yes gene_type:complete
MNDLNEAYETLVQQQAKEIAQLKKQNKDLEEQVGNTWDRDHWAKQSQDIAELLGEGEWGNACGDTLISVKQLKDNIDHLKEEVHRLRILSRKQLARERATYDAGFKEGVNCETSEWEVWTGATRADMKYAMTKA